MKRILLACFLLTATVGFVPRAVAQTTTTVSASDFTAKVNLMDTQLGSGDVTSATATWNSINTMMKAELAVTKRQIASATSDPDKLAATDKYRNQAAMYKSIWGLKADLAANRGALHTQLLAFGATI